MLKRLMAFMSVLIVLTACGGQATATVAPAAPVAAAATPEEVHTAFVAAMRAADRPAALALVDQTVVTATSIDEWLDQLDTNTINRQNGTQALLNTEPLGISSTRSRTLGTSRWTYGNNYVFCYHAQLKETTKGWRIVDWTGTLLQNCTPQ